MAQSELEKSDTTLMEKYSSNVTSHTFNKVQVRHVQSNI